LSSLPARFGHATAALAGVAALFISGASATAPATEVDYVPPPGQWATRSPAEVGFDEAALAAAIEYAVANETRQPRDLALAIPLSFSREPFDNLIGPTAPRGDPTGLVVRHGYVVAQWGDPGRVDMTFSITKSFLSTVVGIAVAQGRIGSVDDRVSATIDLPEFSGVPNEAITWHQLLRQTSNWRGTLWGKPDWADRPEGEDRFAWPTAPVPPPGASWKYNDVRVNALALAAMYAWREPLPAVLAREVMGPIGASDGWRWHGYDNSFVTLEGRVVQSVSGGGHWGGGMFIDAWDLARFGLLHLRRGAWGERRIYPDSWYEYASRPTEHNAGYGVMNWFLNTDGELLPSAPAEAVAHLGAGSNMVYVDPVNDLVVAARWIDRGALDGLIGRVLAALAPSDTAR